MLYNIVMLLSAGVSLLGALVFLFVFWKRLKEDYAVEMIFETCFYVLLAILIGWLISLKFSPEYFLWAVFASSILGLYIGVLRFKLRFYEALETLVIASLPWLSFIFLKDSVVNSSLSSFIGFLVILIIIFAFYFLDTHYREFTWYKSGKVGFAGLSTLAIIFAIRTATFLAGIRMLSYLYHYEAILSGFMILISLVLLWNLSHKIS